MNSILFIEEIYIKDVLNFIIVNSLIFLLFIKI